MKKIFYLLLLASAGLFFQSCVEAEDLVTPNVAAPVLVLLQGNAFPAATPVSVNSRFLELDKTNILDHTKGIDSIPVANLNIRVLINNTNQVANLTTDATGRANLSVTWQDLGLTTAAPGNQVRLEFTGTYKNIPFRKYHVVRVQ